MKRSSLIVLIALASVAVSPRTWSFPPPADADTKGTYLGVLFSRIPELVYSHLPKLPAGQGVVVTHVLPDSPAAKAKLQKHDLLLSYDDVPIKDCEHLGRLILKSEPGDKVRLGYLRGGQAENADVTLTLGPAIRIASGNKTSSTDEPRAVAKPSGPPPVSVAVVPLVQNGKYKVTVEYYHEGTGRIQVAQVEGTPADVLQRFDALPERERQLARTSLLRLLAALQVRPDRSP